MMNYCQNFDDLLEWKAQADFLRLSDVADFGILAMQNAIQNLQSKSKPGLQLKDKFQQVPALIIGAGPSLEKEAHLMEKFQNKGLIFAGGSALSLLPIAPHFAAGIDKSEFKKHPYPNVPFCYQNRIVPDALSFMQGELLLFPESSFPMIQWLEKEEPFDAGWVVANFLTAIAVHMGCNPIIFLGVDLCYPEKSVPEAHLVQFRDTWTQNDWIMAAQWTADFARQHEDRQFICASKTSLLPIGKMSFKDILQTINLENDYGSLVASFISQLPYNQRLKSIPSIEILHQYLLNPLWLVWKPVFENAGLENMEIQKELFFQRILEEYAEKRIFL